ncbi:BTAD domain-containing putative transcriptional regulator [Streptomyces sp. WELS2]|uniref:BTAD domain-containing putative transcriptional regulator n=1 Tax=Streptomyces sp. WELS2 TaxID=2749435 RepID=UPI002867E335|nr:BTAD domain-containing putative transcriptional regulator [Streptomyces sp. WELS2]
MRALYGSGRQAEALAAYEDMRRLLRHEPRVDPARNCGASTRRCCGATTMRLLGRAPARPGRPARTACDSGHAQTRTTGGAKGGVGRLLSAAIRPRTRGGFTRWLRPVRRSARGPDDRRLGPQTGETEDTVPTDPTPGPAAEDRPDPAQPPHAGRAAGGSCGLRARRRT